MRRITAGKIFIAFLTVGAIIALGYWIRTRSALAEIARHLESADSIEIENRILLGDLDDDGFGDSKICLHPIQETRLEQELVSSVRSARKYFQVIVDRGNISFGDYLVSAPEIRIFSKKGTDTLRITVRKDNIFYVTRNGQHSPHYRFTVPVWDRVYSLCKAERERCGGATQEIVAGTPCHIKLSASD